MRRSRNAQRTNNTAPRSKKGPRQDRNQAVTTENDRLLTRKFILNERVGLNTSVGTNTVLNRTVQWDGDELQGFNAISAGFDQYRISRIQVFITPCATSITQIQIASSIAKQPIYSCASTTVYSAVDITGGPNPGADIQAFQNCEFRTPHPYKCTKIADFRPRLAQTTGLLYAPNTWVSTTNQTQIWNALHLRFVNSEGLNIFPSPTDQQEFNIRSVVHVEFRHPIYDTNTLTQRLQMLPQLVPARKEHIDSPDAEVVVPVGLPPRDTSI
jgi:hypothetical protein